MKVLYFNCFYGVNEEAIIKALMNLGIEETYIKAETSKIKLSGTENGKNIIFKDALDMVNASKIKENIKNISNKVIDKLNDSAKRFASLNSSFGFDSLSEKDIHNIVCAAACIDYISPEKILSSKIEIGRGMKKVNEEVLQIPSPLIFEILKNAPVKSNLLDKEPATLIGAAIMSCIVQEFTEEKNFLVRGTGYHAINSGIFSVYLGDMENSEEQFINEVDIETGCIFDKQFILECNIDDMNPEIYDVVMSRLLKKGAADVYFTPIIMKKGRPAIKISVLCSEHEIKTMEEVLFRETSTFGIRRYKVDKTMLERNFSKIKTQYGDMTVKKGFYKGEQIKSKPEHDECRRIAEELGIPVMDIYKEVMSCQ